MRVDSINLAHAMARAHSTIKPTSMVLPGHTEMVKDDPRIRDAHGSKARRKKKNGNKQRLNWLGLGCEVDVWV